MRSIGERSTDSGLPYLMPVGDPRREAVGRAAFGTLAAAAAFVLFTVPTKQIKPLYSHAPWENDPFDTVFSFAMFFVALIAAFLLVQVSLCRKSEPLPVTRVLAILRGCRVTVGTMVITLLSCWIGVAVGANRSQWTIGATGFFVVSLILVTGFTAKLIVDLARAPRLAAPERSGNELTADWLGDAVMVGKRESRRFGRLGPKLINLIDWLDRGLVRQLRHHPLVGAGVTALLFGLAVGVSQGLREGYALTTTLLTVGLLSCGIYAFLVTAGAYLGMVHSASPLYGARRRAVDAGVSACVVAIVSLAFRDSLWWIVGSDQTTAGPAQLGWLLGIAVLATFAILFGVESKLGSHSERAADPRRG